MPDGRLLNAEIIARGYGHAYTRFPFSRMEQFRALEREAREAGRGLWADAGRLRLSAAEAGRHVGEFATVCGVVASTKFARTSRGQPTFLNLDRPYPDQVFTIVIWGSDRAAFGRPEVKYAGKRICVTGMIELYRSTPEIVAQTPSQLELGER